MTTEHPGTRHPKAPNLLGIGCAKCGTTSLAALLSKHPAVSSPKKEFHFFDECAVTEESFQGYCNHFDDLPWRMDFTPSYIMDRRARFLIRDWLGTDLRILVILRNPVHRAYSHYCHARKNWLPGSKWVEKMGYPVETLDFEQAIEQEFARLVFDPYHTRHLSYFAKGLYYQQLKRWLELFDRSRITILLFEHLLQNPRAELARLEENLDISLDGFQLEKKNSQSEGTIDSALYEKLMHRYQPDIEKLQSEFQLDLSVWRETNSNSTVFPCANSRHV